VEGIVGNVDHQIKCCRFRNLRGFGNREISESKLPALFVLYPMDSIFCHEDIIVEDSTPIIYVRISNCDINYRFNVSFSMNNDDKDHTLIAIMTVGKTSLPVNGT